MIKKCFGIIMSIYVAIFLMIAVSQEVYAGDINSSEQDLLNYCGGVFYYDGKAYQFTSEALDIAYGKLAEDGIDLTPAKVQAAKNLVGRNLKKGIDAGYLVEVPGQDTEVETDSSETDNASTEPDSSETDNASTEPDSSEMNNSETETYDPETDNRDTETESDSRITDNTEPDTDESTTDDEETESGETTSKVEDNTSSEGKSENKTTTHKEEKETDVTKESKEEYTSGQNESSVKEPEVNTKGDKIDISQFLEQEKTNPEIIIEESNSIYTIHDYEKGKLVIAKQEGEVLYQGDLPLKNTGYNGITVKRCGMILLGLCICTIILSLVCGKARRENETEK